MMPSRVWALALAAGAFCPSVLLGAVTIDHQQVGCVIADRFPVLEARLNPSDAVSRARILFRPEGGAYWYSVPMKPEADAYRGVLPKPRKSLKRLEYYVEVTDNAMGSSRTSDYGADVASGPAACKDKLVAGALSSAVSVLVSLPAGVVGLPIVPVGFSAAGVTVAGAAAGTTAGAASAAGGGISQGVIIGGAVAVAAGIGVAVAAGGSSESKNDPRTTDDDGDGFTEAQGDCNDADPRISPNGSLSATARPSTNTSGCGQISPATPVIVTNLSCQTITVTSIDVARGDPLGVCTFPSFKLTPTPTPVGPGETRQVATIGGASPYCAGGPVRVPYSCIDRSTVVVQSSAGPISAGTNDINIFTDTSCRTFCP